MYVAPAARVERGGQTRRDGQIEEESRVQGLGFRVQGLEFTPWLPPPASNAVVKLAEMVKLRSVGFRVQGSGFRV